MDGAVADAMDAAMDIALQAELDAAIDTAKQAAHVEVVEDDVEAALEGFCADHGLIVPLPSAPSALELKNREDGVAMTQEPIE